MRESSSCTDETHSLHGAAESFYVMVIVELVFILIVNFQHTILSLFIFTAACFFCHFSIEAVCSIIKPSFPCFTVNSKPEKFISCSLCLFTVAFRRHIFYISHYKTIFPRWHLPQGTTSMIYLYSFLDLAYCSQPLAC